MDPAGRASRLPIFHDDHTFHDRHEKSFRDMHSRLRDNQAPAGFGQAFGSPWNWEDDLNRLCGDFHKLKPSPRWADELKKRDSKDFGSRESLDDHSMQNSSYVENPQTKSRTFHTSFDVRDYNPSDISVKSDGDTLIIEARHEDDVGGHKNVREFSRSVKIPKDVDAEKLTSTMSNDGILTIQAPVPPKYTSVAYVNQSQPLPQNGSSQRVQLNSQPKPPQTRIQTNYQPAPPQYQYSQYSDPTPPQSPPIQPQYVPQHPKPAPPQPAPQSSYQTQKSQPPQSPLQQQYASTQQSEPLPPPPPPAAAQSQVSQPQHQSSTDMPPPPYPQTTHGPPSLFDAPAPPPMPLDKPVFMDDPDGEGRVMEMALEVPKPFTPDDIVVKLQGKQLEVEATHEEKTQGKASKSSMSRSFDIDEDLDPTSVEAMLRSDGCLLIKGKVIAKQE